jgi:hypothetical protein
MSIDLAENGRRQSEMMANHTGNQSQTVYLVIHPRIITSMENKCFIAILRCVSVIHKGG